MNSYKSLGLVWWKQSKEILDDIRKNDGKICTVRCPKFNCFLKELPRISSINSIAGALKPQQAAQVVHASENKDGLSKETADLIEKAIGFKVFTPAQEFTFVPPKAPKIVEEAYPENEMISPAVNLPALKETIKDTSNVAVTTLYNPREREISRDEKSGYKSDSSFELKPLPHNAHPVIGKFITSLFYILTANNNKYISL
jgi:hypothetical protein